MGEYLYLKWGKSYLEINNGTLTIKNKGSFIMNGVLGGKPTDEPISDSLENFSLLYCSKD